MIVQSLSSAEKQCMKASQGSVNIGFICCTSATFTGKLYGAGEGGRGISRKGRGRSIHTVLERLERILMDDYRIQRDCKNWQKNSADYKVVMSMVYDKKETSRKKHIYDRRKKNDVRKLETRARLRGVSIVRMGAWHKSTFWMSRLKCLLTSFGKNGGGKVTTQPRKCQLPVVPYDLGQFQTKAAN